MIDLSVHKPVSVTVGVLLVILFGILSLLKIPVQLTPDIIKPEITVETRWFGAGPHEIEREIVDEQEDQLKGVEGAERITSESLNGVGRIVLRFPPGTDMDAAMLRVSNRLEQVPEYPRDADKPVISTSNRTDNAIAWFMLHRLPGNNQEMDTYYRLAEDDIKPQFERVPGIGTANIFGGREEELEVLVHPERLAERSISWTEVMRALDRENANLSGGDFTEGKRKYLVRTVGEYLKPEDVEKVVLEAAGGKRVYLRDVAEVRMGMKKKDNFVRQRGRPTIAINCLRRAGANVLETMARVKEVVVRLNQDFLVRRGLTLVQVYDETEYIDESINHVLEDLAAGSVLAVAVLYLFLRHFSSTFIIAVAIPISIIGSFILMQILGRTVNVISLAGMSFASGMVVDNSIVSLENIFRHRQMGKGRIEAALDGTREVWGAILASTLTTIAVFFPIFFMAEQAAQLFKDIAIAISCSIGLSLFVSITVIPSMAAQMIRGVSLDQSPSLLKLRLFERFGNLTAATVRLINRHWLNKLAAILLLTGFSIAASVYFLPNAEYLPEGNRNLVIGILLPPPGYSIDEISAMGSQIEKRIERYLVPEGELPEARGGSSGSGGRAEAAALSGGPRILHFFYVARENAVFMGARAADSQKAAELVPVLKEAIADLPGVISVVRQTSLFERGAASGRRVDIEISGPDLEELVRLGGRIFGQTMQLFPFSAGHQARPIPSLDLQTPEVRITPDRERAKDLGLDALEIGVLVDALLDGAKASDYKIQGREVDLMVMGAGQEKAWRTQDLKDVPVYTPAGKVVTLGSVARIDVTRGPEQINHIETQRSITIQLIPSKGVPLEAAIRTVQEEIVRPLQASGELKGFYNIHLAGTADELSQALRAFQWNFVLAVIITYLLMAALFESFLYPFIILFSVPLAAGGGVCSLHLLQIFVPEVKMDILTMLGFVILVGVVVNNAILIVYQSLEGVRQGMDRQEAILEAVRTRLRPIFMTAFTSVFGMLPLVVSPGAGSELYRGLGSVVTGGLLVSTLSLVLDVQALLGRLRLKGTPVPVQPPGGSAP